MPYGIMSATIILFLAACIFYGYGQVGRFYKKIGWFPLLANSAFFLILIVTLGYSENIKFGWRQIERGLPILMFPLILLYFPPKLSKKQLWFVLGTFVFANLLFIAYLYGYLVNYASDFKLPEKNNLVLFEGLRNKGFTEQIKDLWNGTFYETLYYAKKNSESYLDIHKTYASQNILWSIVIVAFFSLKRKLSLPKKIGQVLLLVVLAGVLIYLYSLTNLLLFGLLLPFLIYAVLGLKKYGLVTSVGIVAVGITAFLLVTSTQMVSSESYERYKQHENPLFIISNIKKMLEKDERNTINECNLTLIKQNPFLGYGVGDVQDVLNACYVSTESKSKGAPSIREQNLNSHNYYAFLALAGGVLVIAFFLLMLGYNTFIGFGKKDFLYLAFLFIITMNLLTENTLGRAHGILFFALFNGLFLTRNFSYSENET